jgi:hypothetical protein
MINTAYRLQLMIGPQVPGPAPPALMSALETVEVTHQLGERSGFQVTFSAPYADLMGPVFTVFNRLVLMVIVQAKAQVLIDGFITNQSHQPGDTPGASRLTLTGEDVSLAMDREDKPAVHPGQSDAVIAAKLIGKYAMYGLIPAIVPPEFSLSPSPTGDAPRQSSTDLAYLRKIAERHAFVFQVLPGPAVGTSTAYWGPPVRDPAPQPALSVNLGGYSTVNSLTFQHNSLSTETVSGPVQDGDTNQVHDVLAAYSTQPPLALLPDWLTHRLWMRQRHIGVSGPGLAQAQEIARAAFQRSTERALTGSGDLDTARYGDILQVGGLVGVRGAGLLYDGFYLVRSVTHTLQRGSYRQRFMLSREGLGTTTPMVRP